MEMDWYSLNKAANDAWIFLISKKRVGLLLLFFIGSAFKLNCLKVYLKDVFSFYIFDGFLCTQKFLLLSPVGIRSHSH